MAGSDSSSSFNKEMRNKRPRCNNFTIEEKTILFQLIEKYGDIILSKRTDRPALEEKEHTWGKITCEFNTILGYDPRNSAGPQPRPLKNLKCCFENYKKKKNKVKDKDKGIDCQEVIPVKQEIFGVDDYESNSYSCENSISQDNWENRISNEPSFADDHKIDPFAYIPEPVPEEPPTASVFSAEAPTNSDKIIPKKQLNRFYSKSNISKKSRNIVTKLKMRLLRKELEIKELELSTQKTISDLKIRTEKAKLEFYERKNEMLKAQCHNSVQNNNTLS